MAWPGTLTEEMQRIVPIFEDQQVRDACLKLVSALNACKNTFDTYWGQIQPATNEGLADGDVITNGSGLAGAEAQTKADMVAAMAIITTALDQLNTQGNRNFLTTVVGGVNMLRS